MPMLPSPTFESSGIQEARLRLRFTHKYGLGGGDGDRADSTTRLDQLADHACVIMAGGAVSCTEGGVLRATRAMVHGRVPASCVCSGARRLCTRALGGRTVSLLLSRLSTRRMRAAGTWPCRPPTALGLPGTAPARRRRGAEAQWGRAAVARRSLSACTEWHPMTVPAGQRAGRAISVCCA